ncbi:OsmC family protein [Candidatus Bathyarchaeota archaeon]|nr:MAG: OsmC family protein [Candidatus Bathyarchaeota archaeon]
MISPELRQRFETLRQDIVTSGTSNTFATDKAEVRLIKDQPSETRVRGFDVIQYEPESIGGTGMGPTPTDYFIASIGFCENVIFVRKASLAGLSVDSLETTVTGSWDRRGLFEIDNVAPYFTGITVETKVSTRDPVERVIQVARETHRRCPVHATLARATDLTFKLVVNGQSVQI